VLRRLARPAGLDCAGARLEPVPNGGDGLPWLTLRGGAPCRRPSRGSNARRTPCVAADSLAAPPVKAAQLLSTAA
jgi:hypothetical protein